MMRCVVAAEMFDTVVCRCDWMSRQLLGHLEWGATGSRVTLEMLSTRCQFVYAIYGVSILYVCGPE